MRKKLAKILFLLTRESIQCFKLFSALGKAVKNDR